jgi:hypothetical protein
LPEAPSVISPSQLPDRIFSTDALNQFHFQEQRIVAADVTMSRVPIFN